MVTYFRNKLIIVLIIVVIISYSIPLQAADIIPLEGLKKAEEQLYGTVSDAAILEKINNLESDIFGHKTKGSLADRAQEIVDYVFSDGHESSSLVLLLPFMEWTLYNQIIDGGIIQRIENIEMSIYGEVQEGAIVTRMETLTSLLVPDDEALFKKIQVPEYMEVHIRIEEEIDTAKLDSKKLINFTIPSNVKIDGYLIIPAGTKGILKVTGYKKAGNFGSDAELKIEINDIKVLDGNTLSLNLESDNDQENQSKEMAVGVSLLSTIIISNPVGLVAGYFLKGKDIIIPEGTVIRTQVIDSKEVYGIKTQ